MLHLWAGEMSQHLRPLASLSEDLNSVPSTHLGQLPAACSTSSRRSIALQMYMTHTERQDIYMHVSKNKS